jgi:hypothetical protein
VGFGWFLLLGMEWIGGTITVPMICSILGWGGRGLFETHSGSICIFGGFLGSGSFRGFSNDGPNGVWNSVPVVAGDLFN